MTTEWPDFMAPFFADDDAPASREDPRGDDSLSLLLLDLGGARVAIDLLRVAHVMRTPPVTLLPLMPPAMLGIASERGAVLPVVHLARALGLERAPAASPPCCGHVVVLAASAAIGLWVPAVLQAVRVPAATLVPVRDQAAAQFPWAAAFAPLAGQLTAILAVDALEHAMPEGAGALPRTAAVDAAALVLRP